MKTNCKISDVTAFLRRLEMNNDRAWFKEHKAEYDVLRKAWEADIERLIMLVSEYDEGSRGLNIKNSVYRIYRDIRFRKDKSPYKNYFSAVIGKGGRHTYNPQNESCAASKTKRSVVGAFPKNEMVANRTI